MRSARPRQRLLVRGVEAEEAQLAGAGVVVHLHQQLAARAQWTSQAVTVAFDLHHLPVARITASGVMRVSSS
jgi:hypothetical protein